MRPPKAWVELDAKLGLSPHGALAIPMAQKMLAGGSGVNGGGVLGFGRRLLRAPRDGIVQQLQVSSVGAVVNPVNAVFLIVPADKRLGN